jgi:hypothetical protein
MYDFRQNFSKRKLSQNEIKKIKVYENEMCINYDDVSMFKCL